MSNEIPDDKKTCANCRWSEVRKAPYLLMPDGNHLYSFHTVCTNPSDGFNLPSSQLAGHCVGWELAVEGSE